MKPESDLPPGDGAGSSAHVGSCGCQRQAVPVTALVSVSVSGSGIARLDRRRRAARFAGWVMPGTVLALMPKCPVCFAGYIALATGLGISISAAAVLRSSLIAGCVAALAVLSFRLVRRWLTVP